MQTSFFCSLVAGNDQLPVVNNAQRHAFISTEGATVRAARLGTAGLKGLLLVEALKRTTKLVDVSELHERSCVQLMDRRHFTGAGGRMDVHSFWTSNKS